jgi:Ca2+-binding EF-hand superfamily protein
VATARLIVPTGNSHLCPLGYDYTFAVSVIFALMDGDGDGTISLEEFQAAHARIFKAIDADKDGTLTLEEMQSFLRGAGKGTAER